MRARLPERPVVGPLDRGRRILLNLLLATGAIGIGNLAPMYFIGRWYGLAALSLVVSVACWVSLYFTW